MVGSRPSRRPSSVAWGPPPWTTATRMPAREKLAHRGPDTGRETRAIGGQLTAHLHHEPPSGEIGERRHGQSPGSFKVSVSSNPIITLKAWMA